MSIVKVTLPVGELPVNGKQVSFVAPCDCTQTEALQIEGANYTVVDALGNCVTGKGGKWAAGAVVSVILDVDKKYAYLQNGNLTAEQVTLPNATATVLGLSAGASVDDALGALLGLANDATAVAEGRTKIEVGSYKGTNSTSPSITLGFAPKLIIIKPRYTQSYANIPYMAVMIQGATHDLHVVFGINGVGDAILTLTWSNDGKTVSWKSNYSDASFYFNSSGIQYDYVAFS